MAVKIINLYNEIPPYDAFPRNFWIAPGWQSPTGQWLGVWQNNFLYFLGKEILRQTKEFNYEIWQPDLRADKIYSYTLDNGITHRSFPAIYKKKIYGLKFIKKLYSGPILEELAAKAGKENIIINLNGSLSELNIDILRKIKHMPIVFSFHGEINLPSVRMFVLSRNIFSKLNLISEHICVKHFIKQIQCITHYSDKHINYLKRIYKGRIEKITMGCDFSFFKKIDKSNARNKMNLPGNKRIIISVSNLNERKQIDKFIETLIRLKERYDFLYIVVGCGNEEYEKYLKRISEPLLNKKMIKFVGYQRGEDLLNYLNSADLFAATATSEGGPVSVMEAFACEVPVFSTKTGNTAELMEQQEAGLLVGNRNYKEWGEELERIFTTSQLPKVLNREIAKKYYDWENIAKKFVAIYRDLL